MSGKKEKQYVIENAQLMTEWDWERNDSLGFNPNSITCGSTKKAWWKCSSGHLWQAIVEDRVKGNGCPYCSGRIAIPGVNDLATVNPKLAAEWDDEKNGSLKPSMVMPGSKKKYGGDAHLDTNGRQRLIAVLLVPDVHIVLEEELFKG